MAKAKDSGEFFSDSHRDAYIAALESEIATAKREIAAEEDNPDFEKVVASWRDVLKAAEAELKRVKAAA